MARAGEPRRPAPPPRDDLDFAPADMARFRGWVIGFAVLMALCAWVLGAAAIIGFLRLMGMG